MLNNFCSMKTDVAQILLEKKAVKIEPDNPFTWVSGIVSPIYCDNRVLISYPDAVSVIVLAFKELVENMKFDIIAGVATSGIPWAAFLAYELDKPMIYVRKEAKAHGTKSQIEGVMKKGQKVLLVEDLVSTGKSSLEAVNAIRKEGGVCNNVVGIFQYGFPVADEAFKAEKCSLATITDFPTLLDQLEDIDEKKKREVLRFAENPKEWRK